ncbi:hypothetical protein NQZ71_13235 [Niallia taxi]|uniref:hypothetical protein n=1 Tax=Niallia taxi TaxID=2499688 RepID=UPI002934A280|nr:hypothetical protein [Niallia taxi]WOD61779.1 hypothetical protein NQZ71_13235 [Niallia taxi]
MTELVKAGDLIKEIPGFSLYLANLETGKIYKKPTATKEGFYLNLNPNDVGYVYGSFLNDNGDWIPMSVHTVILAAAFEDNPTKPFWLNKNLEIDHRNSLKHDCRFNNLSLVTKKLNHQKIDRSTPKSKRLKDEVVIGIRKSYKDWVESGKPKIAFYKATATELGMNCWQTAQYICLNINYKNVKGENDGLLK